jgi:hypothetical protein
MFGKHLTHIAPAIAIAAVVTALAVPSALAGTNSSDRTRAQACQPESWITVTDDLGLSQLVPVASAACSTSTELACRAATQTGWVSVNDDLGVPFLVPTNPTEAAAPGLCVLSTQSSPAPAAKITKAKITKSRYSGWVVVTKNGKSKLVSRSDIRG